MRYSYPVLLDLAERLIVIVGGGAVAARKARGVVDAGAKSVRAIAPQFPAEFPAGVLCITEPYAARQLDGAALVFAATSDPDVNGQVVVDARERGILVSRADADDDAAGDAFGDFIVPAVARRGPVTIAISAAGSPAMAAFVRDELAAAWDETFSRLAELSQSLRSELRKQSSAGSAEHRRGVFRDLASSDALRVLQTGGADAVRDWLKKRHPQVFASSATHHAS